MRDGIGELEGVRGGGVRGGGVGDVRGGIGEGVRGGGVWDVRGGVWDVRGGGCTLQTLLLCNMRAHTRHMTSQ